MKTPPNFWNQKIINWELKRYDSIFSKIIFSSLLHRRKYLAYVISQAPKNFKIVELGCGTGRLYELLTNKEQINYTGYDISHEAIEIAKKKFSHHETANWVCDTVDNIKNIKADLIFSAGMLDWLTDEQIYQFQQRNFAPYFIHSFSLDITGVITTLHKIFSKFLSWQGKIQYTPRKFEITQIKNFFPPSQQTEILTHPDLSFGAFIYHLPTHFNMSFAHYKTVQYFNSKANQPNHIELFFKKNEAFALEKKIALAKQKDVLEIGSGYGFYTQKILIHQPKTLTALDPSTNTKNFVKSNNYTFLLTHFENVEINKKFDLIFAIGIIEFITDQLGFLAHLKKNSKPGTTIIIMLPDSKKTTTKFYINYHRSKGHFVNLPTLIEFTNNLEKFGFKIESSEPIGLFNQLLQVSYHE